MELQFGPRGDFLFEGAKEWRLITPKSSLDSRVSAHVERAERDADTAELEALPEVVVTPPNAVDRATSVPSLPHSAPSDVLKERLE